LGNHGAAHADTQSGDIVYSVRSGFGNESNLVLQHPDGENQVLVDLGNDDETAYPSVSPDGSKVAFIIADCYLPNSPNSCDSVMGESQVLAVVNTDGSDLRALTFGDPPDQPTYDLNTMWSPDGEWIYFKESEGANDGIDKIHPDGSDETSVISDSNSSDYTDVTLSPNGDKIAYDKYVGGATQLFTANTDGSDATAVPDQPSVNNWTPSWAPDGDTLVFASFTSWLGSSVIDSINTDGSDLTQLTPSDGSNPIFPVVSPDGATVLYSYSPTFEDLYSVPMDGSKTKTDATEQSQGNLIYEFPAWMPAAFPSSGAKTLVALGDSVAAGEGINFGYYWNGTSWSQAGTDAPLWVDTTAAMGDNYQSCDQSSLSYDRLLYGQGYKVYSMACTGASAMYGVLGAEPVGSGTVPAQLGGSCTGCASDSNYYDAHNPDIVTLTVGADDINFSSYLNDCYNPTYGTCNTSGNSSTLTSLLSSEKTNLRSLLTELNRRAGIAGKNVEVVVTNYYNPFPSTYTSCIDTSASVLNGTYPGIGITSAEQSWIVSELSSLNSNISSEVTYAQSHDSHLTMKLADISGAMLGHQLCDSNPWVYGPSIDYPSIGGGPGSSPAPFHPTPAGQAAIAAIVASTI
jgi:hypothetical protein